MQTALAAPDCPRAARQRCGGKHIQRGYAQAELNQSLDPALRKERLRTATRLILKRFANATRN